MIGNIFPTQSQCKLCKDNPQNKIINERRIEIPMDSQAYYSFIGNPNIQSANQPPINSSKDMWHISSYDSPKFNQIPPRNRKKRTRIFDARVSKLQNKEIKQIIQPLTDVSQQVRLLRLQIKQYQRHEKLFAENERLLKSCNDSMRHKNEQQVEHLLRENKRLLSLRHSSSPNKQETNHRFQQLLTPFSINDDSIEVNKFTYSSKKFQTTPKTVEASPARESPVKKMGNLLKADIPMTIQEKNNETKESFKPDIEPYQPVDPIKVLNRRLQFKCALLQSRSQNVNPRRFVEHINGDTGFLY